MDMTKSKLKQGTRCALAIVLTIALAMTFVVAAPQKAYAEGWKGLDSVARVKINVNGSSSGYVGEKPTIPYTASITVPIGIAVITTDDLVLTDYDYGYVYGIYSDSTYSNKSASVALTIGANHVYIIIKDIDQGQNTYYDITVTRLTVGVLSSDAHLHSVKGNLLYDISGGNGSSPSSLIEAKVDTYGITELLNSDMVPAYDATAQLIESYSYPPEDQRIDSKALSPGKNDVYVTVTAADNNTRLYYKLIVSRNPSNDRGLKTVAGKTFNLISVPGAGKEPAWPLTGDKISVPADKASISITEIVPTDLRATVTLYPSKDFKLLTSQVSLVTGDNHLYIKVAPEDHNTPVAYYDVVVTRQPVFVAVTGIFDVPTAATTKQNLTLTGTVTPTNATNKTIAWSVKNAGATGATISGNTFKATAAGTAIITATIVNGAAVSSNFTRDFTILVNPSGDSGDGDGGNGDGGAATETNFDGNGTPLLTSEPTPARPLDISTLSAANLSIANKVWTGKKISSGLSVKVAYKVNGKLMTKTLREGLDYTPSAPGANKNIGKATVTITGKSGSAYAGTKTLTFNIVPKKAAIKKITVGKKTLTLKWKKSSTAQKITGYKLQYRVKGAAKWKTKTVSAKKASVTFKKLAKGKKYQVRISAYKTIKSGTSKGSYYAPYSVVKLSKKVK